jgi:hypothetical protein
MHSALPLSREDRAILDAIGDDRLWYWMLLIALPGCHSLEQSFRALIEIAKRICLQSVRKSPE